MTNIVEQLKIEQGEIQVKINKIQEACSHPEDAVDKVPGSSTGSPMERDEYWYNITCNLCLKKWREDQ